MNKNIISRGEVSAGSASSRAKPSVGTYIASISAGLVVAGSIALGVSGGGTLQSSNEELVAPTALMTLAESKPVAFKTAFTQAGELENGSLDIRQTLESWRDAGMPVEDARAAMDELGSAMPVVVNTLHTSEYQLSDLYLGLSHAAMNIRTDLPDLSGNLIHRYERMQEITPQQHQAWENVISSVEKEFGASAPDAPSFEESLDKIKNVLEVNGTSSYQISLKEYSNLSELANVATRLENELGVNVEKFDEAEFASTEIERAPLRPMNALQWKAWKSEKKSEPSEAPTPSRHSM